jgi:hypothetical protein
MDVDNRMTRTHNPPPVEVSPESFKEMSDAQNPPHEAEKENE